jgi:hypothetical protein
MVAVIRAQHKLTGIAKRYRSFSDLDCPLPDYPDGET